MGPDGLSNKDAGPRGQADVGDSASASLYAPRRVLRKSLTAISVWFPYKLLKRSRSPLQVAVFIGAPDRIRTGVLALRGLCPGPLDDGSEDAGPLQERGIIGIPVDCSS